METICNEFKKKVFLAVLMFAGLTACRNNGTNTDEDAQKEAKTPVTLTHVSIGSISESIEMRGTSVFQKKAAVKANAAGYIDNITVNIGEEVELNQILFIIKTKETSAIENLPVLKDSSLKFSGLLKIKAQKSGILTTLDHQKGDYVQDGDQLGIISERSSLVFILEVPFELHSLVKVNSNCDIVLPDGQTIKGSISRALSSVDALSQTQSFVVKPLTNLTLPENLIAKVLILKNTKTKAVTLPKASLSADETQTKFWIMKIINDSTAVKVYVKKGIETNDKVEIIEPHLEPSDRIVLTGNYGLADTAKIKIQKTEE